MKSDVTDKAPEITSDVPPGLKEDVDNNGYYPSWYYHLLKEHKAEGLKVGAFVALEPELFKRFMDHLGRFVVHDKTTKTLVFLTGISAYTKDPINLFLRGESSTGKTYNITRALRYFPVEDLIMLGGLSPKAIVHRYGILEDRNGNLIDFSEQPSKRKPKKTRNESQDEYEMFAKTAEIVLKEVGHLLFNKSAGDVGEIVGHLLRGKTPE